MKKKPRISKKEKNLRVYTRNFPPVTSKNISYQKGDKRSQRQQKAKKSKCKFSNKKGI